MYGKDWTDLDNQLDFVNWELNNTHKKAGDRLRQVKGVYNTGRVMSDDYEIPAKKWNSNDDRQRAVFDLHQKYSGVALTDEDRANFNKKKERTSNFTNFEMAENRGNLATVPDVEEKPEVVEAIKTLDSKQNEMNFLKEMFSKQNEDFTVVEPKKVVAQQIAPTNIMETYAKIDNFVEAQQGGAIEEDKKSTKNKKESEVSNSSQEVLNLIQMAAKYGGKSAMSKIPFSIGSAIGGIQSVANNKMPNLSDVLGLVPNGYGQFASLIALEAENEYDNMKKFNSNKNKGKILKPKDKETYRVEVDNTRSTDSSMRNI
jgi:hypothetical protein